MLLKKDEFKWNEEATAAFSFKTTPFQTGSNFISQKVFYIYIYIYKREFHL
jgi:hypothetical protein